MYCKRFGKLETIRVWQVIAYLRQDGKSAVEDQTRELFILRWHKVYYHLLQRIDERILEIRFTEGNNKINIQSNYLQQLSLWHYIYPINNKMTIEPFLSCKDSQIPAVCMSHVISKTSTSKKPGIFGMSFNSHIKWYLPCVK